MSRQAQAHGCPVELKSPVTRENLSGIEPLGVLAGLVPAIPRRMRSIRPHAASLQETFEVGGLRTAWMPGTSPGTARKGCERPELYNRSCRTGQPWREAGHDAPGVQKAEYCNYPIDLGSVLIQKASGAETIGSTGSKGRFKNDALSTIARKRAAEGV
jgi:hypothetical protein